MSATHQTVLILCERTNDTTSSSFRGLPLRREARFLSARTMFGINSMMLRIYTGLLTWHWEACARRAGL